jgi:hypothetical protein
MAVVARRRGGVPLILITLVGCALVMRSSGPEQLRLPWHAWVTVLPYGLLVFLTWAMAAVLPHSAVGVFIEVPPPAP